MAKTLVLTREPQNLNSLLELEEGGTCLIQNLASSERAFWLMQPAAPAAPRRGFILPLYAYLAHPVYSARETPPLWMWALKENTVRILVDVLPVWPVLVR